ncbi:unnamed protein product, partial [marine sediment metagenome]
GIMPPMTPGFKELLMSVVVGEKDKSPKRKPKEKKLQGFYQKLWDILTPELQRIKERLNKPR